MIFSIIIWLTSLTKLNSYNMSVKFIRIFHWGNHLLPDCKIHQLCHLSHRLRPDGRALPYLHPQHRDGVHFFPRNDYRHRRALCHSPGNNWCSLSLWNHGNNYPVWRNIGYHLLLINKQLVFKLYIILELT